MHEQDWRNHPPNDGDQTRWVNEVYRINDADALSIKRAGTTAVGVPYYFIYCDSHRDSEVVGTTCLSRYHPLTFDNYVDLLKNHDPELINNAALVTVTDVTKSLLALLEWCADHVLGDHRWSIRWVDSGKEVDEVLLSTGKSILRFFFSDPNDAILFKLAAA